MKKNEYIGALQSALTKAKINDIEEILADYEQHFVQKMEAGYSEEEIAAQLGRPDRIAAQFAEITPQQMEAVRMGALPAIGLGVAAVPVVLLFILGALWGICMAIFAFASAICGGFLIGKINLAKIIPTMPYSSALLFGIALMALAILTAAATMLYFAYLSHLWRQYFNWQRRTINGESSTERSQQQNQSKRTLQTLIRISLILFGVFAVAGYLNSVILSGQLEFWHAWHWFA